MKKHTLICCILGASFYFLLPAMADTIILKSGKSLEGAIVEETDAYLTIMYAGIPLKYWKDDIAQIKKDKKKNSKTLYAVRSASHQDGVLKITIKEDHMHAVASFIEALDAARSGIASVVGVAQSKFATGVDGHITEANRKTLNEAVSDLNKKIGAIKKMYPPVECQALHAYALSTAEAETKRFAGAVDSFATIAELREYWSKYSQSTLVHISKKYDEEKQRILTKYNITLPVTS
ncbi:MAG: hypothetical protein PHV55_01830 [Candidatus Omnitrophica bacterium]|nr:hypothetical protein [Candidatus Omnitrophota bacterium]